jgi:hypothetical protein
MLPFVEVGEEGFAWRRGGALDCYGGHTITIKVGALIIRVPLVANVCLTIGFLLVMLIFLVALLFLLLLLVIVFIPMLMGTVSNIVSHTVLRSNRMLIVCVSRNQVSTHTIQKMDIE